ncbi:hypothetical protein K435DRAFT_685208 [Dendrothele bispora CBS 962.96]|uniref:Uncharacterized protein n=1 Tax=Dendrothele bispora (strain CBS 962.96) TaxID=1314807 RepID=A0A4S8LA16_DENBC|nr:hypothetical protein K435DRAFT_685208 [Dendrothele bispora CBS 962.96]
MQAVLSSNSNFPKSEFACITVNFGPCTRTHIHTNAKNTAHDMCATTLGSFNPKLRGHLVLWDLKVLIEFPPGCTILLLSALLYHLNTGVQTHKTRYSVTQYTAGGIWCWLDGGSWTKVNIKHSNPEGWQKLQVHKKG